MNKNLRKSFIIIIKATGITFGLMCLLSLIFFFIIFFKTSEIVHFSPKIEIKSINSDVQNYYAVSSNNNYYCYKSKPTPGIYKILDIGDDEKIYEVSDVVSVASDEEFIYILTRSSIIKINFDGELAGNCEIKKRIVDSVYYIIIESDSIFVFYEPYSVTKQADSVCIDKVTMSIKDENAKYEFDWTGNGISYSALGVEGNYIFRPSMYQASDTEIIAIGIKDSNYGNFEKPIKKHLNDILCRVDKSKNKSTLIYSTVSGERVVYADHEKYVVYSFDKKGFTFFKMDDGSEYKFLKNSSIKIFRDYSIQAVNNRLFIYYNDNPVDYVYL